MRLELYNFQLYNFLYGEVCQLHYPPQYQPYRRRAELRNKLAQEEEG
jgi:hypothetical protein